MNEINDIVARDPNSKHKDLDHDPIALVLVTVIGRKDGRGYVRGYGDHVSKTTLMAAAPYKKKAQEMYDSYVELLSQVGSLKSQLSEETTARLELQEKVDALLSRQGLGHDLRMHNSSASYEVPADTVSGPLRVQRDTLIPSRQKCELMSMNSRVVALGRILEDREGVLDNVYKITVDDINDWGAYLLVLRGKHSVTLTLDIPFNC